MEPAHSHRRPGGGADYSDNFEARPAAVLREMLRGGVSLPWTLAASLGIGGLLMCTRLWFDTTGAAADNDHLFGALVITFSVMALAEVARPLRFANAAFGLWLVLAPWLLDGYGGVAAAATSLAGVLLLMLALPRGVIASHYGAWDRQIRMEPHGWRPATPTER